MAVAVTRPIVEITFDPTPDGTRLQLVQRLFQNVEQRERHKMGWDSKLQHARPAARLNASSPSSATGFSGRRW